MTIQETTFPGKTYLVWRKHIETKNISDKDMWEKAFGAVVEYAQNNGIDIVGPGTAVYFSWDEESGRGEIGIGMPIPSEVEINDSELSVVTFPQSRAIQGTLVGDYEGLPSAHAEIWKYLGEHDLKPTISLEEYTVMGDENTTSETNLYYLI